MARSLLRIFVGSMASHPSFVRLMLREMAAGLPVAGDLIERLMPMQSFHDLLERAQAAGLIRGDVSARWLSVAVCGLNFHMLSAAPLVRRLVDIDPTDPEDMERMIDTNLRILFSGMWQERETQ